MEDDQEKSTSGLPSYDNGVGESQTPPLEMPTERKGFLGWCDTFKPHPAYSTLGTQAKAGHKSGFDAEAAAKATAAAPLSRKLKGRHLQMIAIGGSIGTGLFVGSGLVLSQGGPAALIIAYGLIGIMLFCTVYALGELAVAFPVSGSFSAYGTRFIDPAWGFAMGFNYALQWLVVLPLEIVAASITIQYWNPPVDPAVFVAVFLLVIISINLLWGARGYGEAEVVFSSIKVAAVLGFIILGIVLVCGGGPNHDFIGGMYWVNPGPFADGFQGVCAVFVNAAFAFGGTELCGLAAAETANPRKTLPTAVKQVFWRICLFYLISLTLVGLLVPYTDPQLLSGSSSVDAKASPFVIAIQNAGIAGLPSVMNVVILISVLSVGNSSVYGSSRTLCALAQQGQFPRIFGYIDRSGRPLVAIAFASILGLLAFLVDTGQSGTILGWLLALSGLSSIFTWGSICACHIMFRAAWKKQGHSTDELAFTSIVGVWGSWVGFIFNILVLIATFYTALYPTSGDPPSAEAFFNVYLAAPIVLLSYILYKLWYRTPFMRPSTIDVVTGRRELDLSSILAEERAERQHWPWYKKWYKFFC